jgi:hypothetical protein
VRDPDLVVVNRSVVQRNPVRVDASDVVLVAEIVSPGSRRRITDEPKAAERDEVHFFRHAESDHNQTGVD